MIFSQPKAANKGSTDVLVSVLPDLATLAHLLMNPFGQTYASAARLRS